MSDDRITGGADSDLAGHHLAGVHADPNLQFHAVFQTHIVGETTGYRLDLQGANACPQCMIFEGDRRSKHRHQAITGEFIERALISLNDCGRPVE